jgi:cell division protease FtsH
MQQDAQPKIPWPTVIFIVTFVALLVLQTTLLRQPEARHIAYSDLLAEADKGRIEALEIRETELVAKLKPKAEGGEVESVVATRLPGIAETELVKQLEEKGVSLSGRIDQTSWWEPILIGWILPLGLLFFIYSMVSRRMQRRGGPMSFGRSQVKIHDRAATDRVTFEDVAGVDEAEAELVEVVDFLKNPQKYRALGARIPKGVLLLGPPGTGKTLLAKAVAGEAQVAFFSISGSEFVEMFVGVGAARVRDMFEQAKKHAPCIIFIDEIDAVGKSRGGLAAMGTHDEREQTLNQLLVEMDGFDASSAVVIMAATNRPEILDPALVRAGRFDRQVLVDRPDVKGREEILVVHARKVKLSADVSLKVIAQRTPGMVGADLANIVNEGALAAARRGVQVVGQEDLEEAIDRIQLGVKKKNRVMGADEKRRVAFHESGHTLVALSVGHADPVHRVTIIPRSVGALGATLQLPTEDRYLMTREELIDRICVMLGGRAAEAVACGDVSTGAQNDLERATETARQMVCRFGMSEKLGPLTYGRSQSLRFLESAYASEERNFSEETARAIDAEVRELVETQYARAKQIVEQKRTTLEHIATRLLEVETLERKELEELVSV